MNTLMIGHRSRGFIYTAGRVAGLTNGAFLRGEKYGGRLRPWLHKRKPLTCSGAQETAEKLPLTDLPASEYLLLSTPVPILEPSSHFSPDHQVGLFISKYVTPLVTLWLKGYFRPKLFDLTCASAKRCAFENVDIEWESWSFAICCVDRLTCSMHLRRKMQVDQL